MMASVGYIFGEIFQPILPGPEFSDVGYKAFTDTNLNLFWAAAAISIAIPEFVYSLPTLKGFGESKQGRVPGDIGFDPLDLKEGFDFLEMQNRELNNGRLAMMAIAGMIGQEAATGRTEFGLLTDPTFHGR